jgi:hypothetical protein
MEVEYTEFGDKKEREGKLLRMTFKFLSLKPRSGR